MRRKKINRRKVFICVCAGIICAGIIAAAVFGGTGEENDSWLAEGRKRLQMLSEQTVPEVEKKIRDRDKQEEQDKIAWENRTPNEKMANAVLLGDSRAEGFAEYDILDQSQVLAEIGISLEETDPYIEQAIGLNPEKVFLSYGLNDLGMFGGDAGKFQEKYRNIIEKLKEALPESGIYVTTILPVQQKALEKDPILNYIGEFNEAIRTMCREEQVICIELGDLVSDELYETDGEHFTLEFYPLWFDRMAEIAEL